ncbi:hypothetical protein CERZMDRAFT_81735 [Cercospora zeae-maydis SCOH1-5]|uniref:Uncharacterized protein n=1 Tax=Cercospora zeae-maydis SCOH1-5 TaxID=717836 RepID=A0A6A6FQB5_9PEZI|nr:hypothetical protein CERZMDRAFT_81735 [Cercospora zeae-maydis SCOH1-5]
MDIPNRLLLPVLRPAAPRPNLPALSPWRRQVNLMREMYNLEPSLDSYDENVLVAPHFSVAPPMTAVEEVYASDPPSNRLQEWGNRNAFIQSRIKDVLDDRHGISDAGRYGLYICGAPEQVLYRPNASGVDLNGGRDRMMVLMVELNPTERHEWMSLQVPLERLMVEAGIEKRHGVCIRFYLKAPESTNLSPIPADVDASSTAAVRGSDSASTTAREEVVWEYPPPMGQTQSGSADANDQCG